MLHKPVSIKLLGACLALPSLVVNGLPVLSGELPMSDAIRNLHPTDTRGSAIIVNNCPFMVYMTACYQPTSWAPVGSCDQQQTINSGEAYAEVFWDVVNNGRSLAIYRDPVPSGAITDPTQFEYTVTSDNTTVYYDVSDVDGNPFRGQGYSIWTTDPSGFRTRCPAPADHCPTVFPMMMPVSGNVFAVNVTRSIGMTLCVE